MTISRLVSLVRLCVCVCVRARANVGFRLCRLRAWILRQTQHQVSKAFSNLSIKEYHLFNDLNTGILAYDIP